MVINKWSTTHKHPPYNYCTVRATAVKVWLWLTVVVDGVDVCVAVHKLLHHALHGQAGCQDQGCGAIIHARVQVCGTVPDQDLQGPKRASAANGATQNDNIPHSIPISRIGKSAWNFPVSETRM